ncbi:MAG: potassium-transporting ATPase subunit KdpC [Acinetobacter sp.]|nr:potassium-transporting ATPase subunit KdpC [Acinetobacter sp.]
MNIENNPLIQPSAASLARASLGLTAIALGLCGFLYSAAAAGLGQALFPDQANGSMIVENDRILGSSLVAQPFAQAKYFHPRPSAANYDPMAMAGSNLARTNPELHKAVEERIAAQEQVAEERIPADLVTASGSGIDPEISAASALIQVRRVAEARHLPEQAVLDLVQQQTIQPDWGVLGKARVNVLELNLALDRMQ